MVPYTPVFEARFTYWRDTRLLRWALRVPVMALESRLREVRAVRRDQGPGNALPVMELPESTRVLSEGT